MSPGWLMAQEMSEQPAVLARLIERVPSISQAVHDIVPTPLAGVSFLARGSSDNAALFGRYLAEMLAGRPAGMAAPSLYTRYEARVDHSGYLVVAISQSGATPEIVSTCAAMRAGGAATIAVTNEAASALAEQADLVLSTDAGVERAVPATKTVTAQMLLMHVIATSLRGPDRGLALRSLPASVETVLTDDRPAAALAARWARVERLYVTARGLLYPAALETALKIKETAGILAEGLSIADLLHGPISSVQHGIPVLVLGPDERTWPDVTALRDRLTDSAVEMATLSTERDADLPVPPGGAAVQTVIAATVRGQQLAWHLAAERGLNPDHPLGLTKVTPTR